MEDEVILGYMNKMLLNEIVPILPLDQEDCKAFAAAVQDRFNNPFVDHQLMSISLNSTSKWRARNMPSFLEYRGLLQFQQQSLWHFSDIGGYTHA
jgi:tagaturonate reductase